MFDEDEWNHLIDKDWRRMSRCEDPISINEQLRREQPQPPPQPQEDEELPRKRIKDCQNDVHVDNQWSDEKEQEYEKETMKERKGRDLSQRICLSVLRLRKATYGTKSMQSMMIRNNMKGYNGR